MTFFIKCNPQEEKIMSMKMITIPLKCVEGRKRAERRKCDGGEKNEQRYFTYYKLIYYFLLCTKIK